MAFSKGLVGWMAACALSAAQAGTLPNANTGTGAGASGSLAHAERFDYADSNLPQVAADLNEQILRIPADASGAVTLEATLFAERAGPFPLVVFNHGKNTGDLHQQPRSRPLAFAREFVRRGYAVIAPNRQGFAGPDGTYQQEGCNVGKNGLAQAADVDATVRYMSHQSYVDASRIVVAGTSHGGLVSVAYGTEAAPGVRGIINFSGGLRRDLCDGWQKNLVDAFDQYGAHTAVRSLWLYGDNDSVWTPARRANARRVRFAWHAGPVHRFRPLQGRRAPADRRSRRRARVVAGRQRVPRAAELPTSVRYAVAAPHEPKASGYASIDSVNAVPYVDEAGREGYRRFLNQHPSRAFAVSSEGAWSWAEGGDDPMALALDNCSKQGAGSCRLYAVNDRVVWNDATQTAGNDDGNARDTGTPALASR